MNLEELHIGAVFELPEGAFTLARVIAFDDETLMCEYWYPENKVWGLGALNWISTFYRNPKLQFLEYNKYLRTEEFTKHQLSIIRPDLPFSFAGFPCVKWPKVSPSTPEEFPNGLIACDEGYSGRGAYLHAPKIYLEPFSHKGTCKAGILIKAENGLGFSVDEILWHAARVQSPFLGDTKLTRGIGIHRQGLRKGLPSYYIWGAESRW